MRADALDGRAVAPERDLVASCLRNVDAIAGLSVFVEVPVAVFRAAAGMDAEGFRLDAQAGGGGDERGVERTCRDDNPTYGSVPIHAGYFAGARSSNQMFRYSM